MINPLDMSPPYWVKRIDSQYTGDQDKSEYGAGADVAS
jgi:hypothetical protein